MSYQRIAELVHELVKNPNSLVPQEKGLPSPEFKMNEFATIQRIFSKLEASGDTLTFETIPLDYW